jgi:hypothetical protein
VVHPEFIKPQFKKGTPDPCEGQLAQNVRTAITEAGSAGRADEDFARNVLPMLFHIDCYFFLQQPWVSKLFAQWHDKGEEFSVHHAAGTSAIFTTNLLECFFRDIRVTT